MKQQLNEQFRRMLKLAGLNEGYGAYEYEEGKEAGEKAEKKKMKKSELKKKIREMILAEMDGGEDYELEDRKQMYGINPEIEPDMMDFDEEELEEAKKKKDEEPAEEEMDMNADIDTPEGGEDMSLDMGTDMGADMGAPAVGGDAQNVQKELMDALEAAKSIGDEKLVRQIGNALTYFTRQQVSGEENK